MADGDQPDKISVWFEENLTLVVVVVFFFSFSYFQPFLLEPNPNTF